MSSKLLYDENNPNLQKQIGCMNGFFQKIYFHQFLTGRRVKGRDKIPPVTADQSGNSGAELNTTLQKASGRSTKRVAKEKQRASTESSRTSFSSSSCSSSFSSLEPSFHGQSKLSENPSKELPVHLKDSVYRASSELSVKTITQEKAQNHIFKHVDSPRPLQFQGLLATRYAPRDAPRFSFDGRVSQDTFKSLKIKELPRLSLDGRQSTIRAANPQQELASYKRQSSVVAKLMGLEAFPDTQVESLSRSAGALDQGKPNHLARIRKADSVNPSSKFPIEPAPWRRGSQMPGLKANTKASNLSASVYVEIEKRLADIEFKKSGKDLRALKRILEAMQKNAEMSESRKDNQTSSNDQSSELPIQESLQSSNSAIIKGSSSPRSSRSLNMITKPATPVNRKGSVYKLHSGDREQASRSMQTLKVATHVTGDSTKSPRLQKKNGPEKQPGSSMSRKQIISQVTESRSPRTKQKPKSPNSQQLKETSSKVRDLRKHGNANSTCSASHTSTKKNLEFKLIANRAVAGVASEQPSPISVLNATFCRDESPSPSPVKKAANICKDDEALDSYEAEWTSTSNLWSESDHNKSESIQYLVSQDESINYTTLLGKDSNQQHIYIYKILLASGLLRGLDSGTAFHPSGSPINLQVFLAVEQSTGLSNISHQKSVEKIQRKLIFDVVNEIIEHKLVPNKLGGRRLKGQQLLRELCSEIDQLEASKSSCSSDDEGDGLTSISWGDLMRGSTEWADYPSETCGLVSDVERLIFKDLIGEVVDGETAGLQTRYCRQLFYQ